ncbi:10842_t:CDS:2 [Funneliformis mosseae]|uniref:10842_t:CDS:1 n=1 Tax=Funneliformis mosseae TaxID=27381 RepID=A0A9N9FXU3_FUNMO|nr:10842_t:CDS:2 [Funneliformis mosseae]
MKTLYYSSAQQAVYWKRDPGVGTKSRIERVIVSIPQSSNPNIETQGRPYERRIQVLFGILEEGPRRPTIRA